MKFYFLLQFRMTNRQWRAFGLSPWRGYGLILFAFVVGSILLFRNTHYAAYLYIALAWMAFNQIGSTKRNELLRLCFPHKHYIKLRLLENLLVAFPFIIFLSFQGLWPFALATIGMAISAIWLSFDVSYSYTIPTPFSKRPFEFSVGFRKTILLIVASYILAAISVYVNNLNLYLFSYVTLTFSTLTYYLEPENELFVWSHSLSPRRFLFKKAKEGGFNLTLLISPIIISLIVFFPNDIHYLFLLWPLAMLSLMILILAKYSIYPYKINLPQIILLSGGVLFPPFLLVVVPYFYFKSIKHLKQLLHD